MNPTEKFITDRIENNLTFNCFDTKRQYSLHTLVEWMDDHAREAIRDVLLGLCYEMQDEKMDKHYDILIKTLEKYPRKMKDTPLLKKNNDDPDVPTQPRLSPEENAKSFLEWAEKGWAIDKAYNSTEKEGQESSSWNVIKPYFEQKLTESFKNAIVGFVYDETRVRALAEIYKRSVHDAAMVATICDDVIDRSGKLLGEVRKVVRR